MVSPAVRTPRQIFLALDRGELTREQFREEMSVHAHGLIEEMVEAHENPAASWMETLRNRRSAARLINAHGEALVREMFIALSDVPGFPLANWLWNADNINIPLYCFLRSRREPLFRVLLIVREPSLLTINVEYGSAKKTEIKRERMTLRRDRWGSLMVAVREPLK